ncbi:glycosyl transferase group 1 [Aciduliprofundum boonei T469]|uniref:Glycosyl transferase group 1 n=2 Tax=Candidatus Aciduliprofundum boonei TaxID=379547 RepID=B5IDH6_ACIB4|nr:glycosyl transferase group 1 [Aciduliprofundum boonei T469]EDY35616.1 glycosyl transferase, group 1 family protein [Aciduliprofundum boonei T469]HII55078.1 glycosyltransferase family 4 protein [Candidatus Aciduliprofundum boonei]
MLLTNPFRPDPRVHEEAKVLVEAGYDVTILCWNRGENYPESEILDGIRVRRINIPSSYGTPGDFVKGIVKFYLASLNILKKEKFDIVHANDFDTLPLAIMLKKLHGWKVVYDAHDHYSSMIADVLPTLIPSIIFKLEKYLLKFTDARIAASKAIARELDTLPFEIVLNAKNLKDYTLTQAKVQQFRAKINPEGKFLIVYIGILKLWTPLPQIIQAVKKLPEVKLIVGGKGPHENEIIGMIKDAKNIEYVGWVNKKYIPLYTLASDLVVLPSNSAKLYTRVAVANKIMEGLAAGKPLIAGTNTEGGKIVRECNAGLLCDYGDVGCLVNSINKLMKDKELYKKYAKNARVCAEKKYNWNIMSDRLIRLYKSLK